MAQRRVVRTKVNEKGEVIALCNPNEYWKRVSKNTAIAEIETGYQNYYVDIYPFGRVTVEIAEGPNGKYLTTQREKTEKNILLEIVDEEERKSHSVFRTEKV